MLYSVQCHIILYVRTFSTVGNAKVFYLYESAWFKNATELSRNE